MKNTIISLPTSMRKYSLLLKLDLVTFKLSWLDTSPHYCGFFHQFVLASAKVLFINTPTQFLPLFHDCKSLVLFHPQVSFLFLSYILLFKMFAIFICMHCISWYQNNICCWCPVMWRAQKRWVWFSFSQIQPSNRRGLWQ